MSQHPTRAQRRRIIREWRKDPAHHPDLQSNVATDIGLWSYIAKKLEVPKVPSVK